MELLAQFGIGAFGASLFALLVAQLPGTSPARSWLYAFIAGTAGMLAQLGITATGNTALGTALWLGLLACSAAQITFAFHGFSKLVPRGISNASLICGLASLAVTAVLAVVVNPLQGAFHLGSVLTDVAVGFICVLLHLHLWHERNERPRLIRALYTLSAPSLVTVAISLGITTRLLPNLNHSSLLVMARMMGSCGVALGLVYLVTTTTSDANFRLRLASERLFTLLDSAQAGICEIDSRGRLQYANRAAVDMLQLPQDSDTEVWLGEHLEPRDELSKNVLRDFALRPTSAITRAHTYIRNADAVIPAEFSSSPVVRNGKTTSCVVTLQDAADREQAEYFLRFRSEILEKIAQNKPVDEVLKLLSTAVESRLPGLSCSLLVCEHESFQVTASSQWPDELRADVNGMPAVRFYDSEDRMGTIERRPWDANLRELARSHGYAGTWTEPMISSANDLLGTIVLNSRTQDTLTGLQQQILLEAARLGALNIEHRRWFERLLHQGHHDVLTGLPNRLLLADRLKQSLARAERTRRQLAYLCIDLDRFKHINDTLGHEAGDLFLQQISVRLSARIRSSDTLARVGGDEFAAILSDIHDVNDARVVAESLVGALREPFDIEGNTVFGGASIGVAIYPQDGTDIESLQRNADRAMYRAKAQGRNGVQFYTPDQPADDADSREIELHLHRAIELGNFALHFQPQFTCDRRLSGFEALLRFNHPKLGLVPPSRFIPMAEESGLILPIGEWVLHEACRQIAEWQKKGMRPVRVAVNVSPLQFTHANFAETVQRALKTSRVNPELLELELTEGVLMSNIRESSRQMAAMAEIGVRLAVDDFGTGYSSLSYLHQLPINLLKIDRSFIAHMLDPDGTRCIVEAIISLAHRLGLETLAEGVENDQQLEELRVAGCNMIQGFLFSRPLTVDDATALLWQETVKASERPKVESSPVPLRRLAQTRRR